MNVNLQSINAGGVFCRMPAGGLKSAQQKQERQEKCNSQTAFLEQQKENLKNITCTSLEEIAHKLEQFHSYEDQIAAVKKEFNYSQMMHALDEAREIGEKIAEEAEEMEPKTAEERRKDMQEEALGTEEDKGVLTEALEEALEDLSETCEELEEQALQEAMETTEELTESRKAAEELTGSEETLDDAERHMAVEELAETEKTLGGAESQMATEELVGAEETLDEAEIWMMAEKLAGAAATEGTESQLAHEAAAGAACQPLPEWMQTWMDTREYPHFDQSV